MAYLDQYISALRYYFDLNPSETVRPDFEGMKKYFMACQDPRRAPFFLNTKQSAALFAEKFVQGYPGELAHSCHSASAGFLNSWRRSFPADIVGTLAMTIGTVLFKGHPLFETTRESVAELIHAGRQSENDIPVHVWLTLEDLTVVDLTVISTLIKRGDVPADTPPVLFWREDCPGDFRFEPILVDNLFFDKVDTGVFFLR